MLDLSKRFGIHAQNCEVIMCASENGDRNRSEIEQALNENKQLALEIQKLSIKDPRLTAAIELYDKELTEILNQIPRHRPLGPL